MFYKISVFKNFAKFTRRHLCRSLFLNKDAGLGPATLLKKKIQHWCFLVNFAKFFRTPFLQNTSSNCFRIVGHHHEDLYFCGKFSCNTKLPVKYQPNISASKIVIVKAELLLRPFLSKQLIKNCKIALYQFFFKIYKWLRWKKKSWNYWCPSSIIRPLCPFQKQSSKVFLKGSCFECFEKFLGKRRPSLGYLQKWGTS